MDIVQKIEAAVTQLSSKQLASFREWFDKFDAEVWDKQFEFNAISGKFDNLANQAVLDFRAGKCREL